MLDLFPFDRQRLSLEPGAVLLGGFALPVDLILLEERRHVTETAHFRHLETLGGRRMSVAMTNVGRLGWFSDRHGYRYSPIDPLTGRSWPAMPSAFAALATEAATAAGFLDFAPEACVINRYAPGTKLSLHQDRDERNLDQPIVSVSFGVDARFLWGGQSRTARQHRVALHHGDVVAWGGPARLTDHGVDTLVESLHPLTGTLRYNLTFRTAT